MAERKGAELFAQLQRRFKSASVILYLGPKAEKKDIEAVANLPWNYLISPREDTEALAHMFAEKSGQDAQTVNRFSWPPENHILRVLSLCEEGKTLDESAAADQFISLTHHFLSTRHLLFILGYDETADDNEDINYRYQMKRLLSKLAPSACMIWAPGENTASLCGERGIPYAFGSLSDAVKEAAEEALRRGSETADEDDWDENGAIDTFYYNGKGIRFPSADLFRFRHIATLLTDNTVFREDPEVNRIGRFKTFLEDSSMGEPQWYGYFRRKENTAPFYVERSFAQELYHKTRRLLEKKTEESPLILCGPPGSSKSVVLAWVAFKVFYDAQYPVVYLRTGNRNGLMLYRNGGDELEGLMDLLDYIIDRSAPATPILLVWDTSHYKTDNAVYQSVHDRGAELLKSLRDVGRNVVLLCSAYVSENDVITGRNDRFTVRSTRELTEREENALKNRLRDYLSFSEDDFSAFNADIYRKENRGPDFFDYIYRLVATLRVPLDSGLSDEQDIVSDFVHSELVKAIGRENVERARYNPFSDFFKSQELFQRNVDQPQQTSREEMKKALEDLNLFLAMCSVFRITVPVDLAVELLCGAFSEGQQLADQKTNLYVALTQQIPWIAQYEDQDGGLYVTYRNVIEAERCISADENGEKRVRLIAHAADFFRDRCAVGAYDETFAQTIQSLLRHIGPNSKYYENTYVNPFCNYWDSLVLKKSQEINDALCQEDYSHLGASEQRGRGVMIGRRLNYAADFEFGIISVTMIRELNAPGAYASLPAGITEADTLEGVREKLKRMNEGFEYAYNLRTSIRDALAENGNEGRRSKLTGNCDTLTAEIAFYYSRIKSLEKTYAELCAAAGITPEASLINKTTAYYQVTEELLSILDRNPVNVYTYNALFQLFEREYEATANEEKKLKLLSEVIPTAAACRELQQDNLAMEDNLELGRHIANIAYLADGTASDISIEVLLARGNENVRAAHPSFFKLFNEMCKAQNPTPVLFVVQRELRFLWQFDKDRLSERDLAVCQKAETLLRQRDIFETVRGNDSALYLLLQITWALENGGCTLKPNVDRSRTKISSEGWKKICEIAVLYHQAVRDKVDNHSVVRLILPLAQYQLGRIGLRDMAKACRLESQFFVQQRQRSPFVVCDENGKPRSFTGRIQFMNSDGKSGKIVINGIEEPVHFKKWAFPDKTQRQLVAGSIFGGVALAVGYMNVSAYSVAYFADHTAPEKGGNV